MSRMIMYVGKLILRYFVVKDVGPVASLGNLYQDTWGYKD